MVCPFTSNLTVRSMTILENSPVCEFVILRKSSSASLDKSKPMCAFQFLGLLNQCNPRRSGRSKSKADCLLRSGTHDVRACSPKTGGIERRPSIGNMSVKHSPGPLTLSEEERRVVALWAADCAERVLPIFEVAAPNDTRPREAIEGARAFARGEMRIGPVRTLSAKAHAAAREINVPSATAAARAAGHAAGVAHMAAHARGVAYAAIAAGLAKLSDPNATAEESLWQVENASPTVRKIIRKLPPPRRSGGKLSTLIADMHVKFTREANQII